MTVKWVFYLLSIYFYTHWCFACTNVCTRMSDSLKLELEAVVCCHGDAGNWTWVFWRKSWPLYHGAISPVHQKVLFSGWVCSASLERNKITLLFSEKKKTAWQKHLERKRGSPHICQGSLLPSSLKVLVICICITRILFRATSLYKWNAKRKKELKYTNCKTKSPVKPFCSLWMQFI